MLGVSIYVLIGLGICGKWGSTQFLNNRPFPTYSLEDMPDTDFSCRDKILGGYYADRQTQCQMFHVCVKVSGVGVQDFRFLCPNSTAFDQEHQICADWEDVDCDAATLYYSSENFDLYRIGSGYESKAAKYGEEEETFALQRAETGDIRLNRDHQTQRVNQQKENSKLRNRVNTQQNTQASQQTNQRNNNYNNDNNEKDLFKGSSSSNFFNNRNAGKETDEYDDDSANINANQNEDHFQKRKLIRKPVAKPDYDEPQTQRPSRPTGFINNFAGSSFSTTVRPSTTTLRNEQHSNSRGRQRVRGNNQNNADNVRQNTGRYQEDDGQYRGDSSGQYNYNNQESKYTVSTPAPFRHASPQNYRQNTQYNSNNDQYSTTITSRPTSPSTDKVHNYNNYNPYNNNQAKVNQNIAGKFESTQTSTKQTKEPENYPSTPFKQANNPSTTYQNQARDTQTYSPAPFKQSQNYSPTPFQKDTKASDAFSATTFRNTHQYSTLQNKGTENYFSTGFNESPNNPSTQYKQAKDETYSSRLYNQDQGKQKQTSEFENQSTIAPFSRNTQQYQNNYEITKNKQLEQSSTQNFKKPTTFAKQGEYNPTTFSPKTSPFKVPTFSESYSSTVGYRNSGYQNNQQNNNNYNNNNNNKQSNYNQEEYQNTNNQERFNQREEGTLKTNNQPLYNENYNQPQQSNRQTTHNIQYKQTTQFTHYTPTVPRITTPSYSTTTSAPSSKRSHRFDETQYDDGSYNQKYDSEDSDLKDEEFLKTAHSINIASSRNEYAQNNRNIHVSSTQKPRPFSVTPNPPKESNYTVGNRSNSTQILPKTLPSHQTSNTKKTKDTSYDYAYYDSNVGSDHEYDIGVDIEKSSSAKNKKNA